MTSPLGLNTKIPIMLPRLRAVLRHFHPRMSSTVHNPNTACCSIPPVHSAYSPKGTFQSIGNFHRVYVTGPDVSENAIICISLLSPTFYTILFQQVMGPGALLL
jgi:hypothetical protein